MFALQQSSIDPLRKVWIASDILALLSKEAQTHTPLETGGVLLGYWAESPSQPVVTHAVGPGPNAIHELNRFAPDYHFQETEIARLYNQSDCSLQYLGDWHSHPGAAGYLSEMDVTTLARIASAVRGDAPEALMVILTFGPEWTPVAWTAKRRRRWYSKLDVKPWEVAIYKTNSSVPHER